MPGRIDHFSIPLSYKKVADEEARRTFQELELILQRLTREVSLSTSTSISATVINDLADVLITAAADDDFLKFESSIPPSGQWINFPLFSSINTWLATQNVQHLIPRLNNTYDLGSSALRFSTLYLAEDVGVGGGNLIDAPTALGTNAATHYVIDAGGGATLGSVTEGGVFEIRFDDLPGADFVHGGPGNELLINFGKGSFTPETSRLVIRTDFTGGTGTGIVDFTISGSAASANFLLEAVTGVNNSARELFRNSIGGVAFGSNAPTKPEREIIFNETDTLGVANIPMTCFVKFQAVNALAFFKMDTEGINSTGAIAIGREIRFAISGAGGAARQRIESRFEVLGGGYVPFTGASTNYTLDLDASVTSFGFIRGARPAGTVAAANPVGSIVTALTTLATCFLTEPNIAIGGGGSLTNACTLYVENAPTEGTNNYALFVDAGTSRIDGLLTLGDTTGVNLSAAVGILTMAGLSGTAENLTWNFTAANIVTMASGTGVTSLVMSGINLDLGSAGVRLSGAAGVLTMLGLGAGTPENLTFDLNTSQIVTLASTTGVTDLVLSFANVRTTTKLEIDGTLDHDGAAVGFFGAAPVGQPTYTQTYATADRTHAAKTVGAALTDNTTGTANTTLVDVGIVFTQANINDNFADLALRCNELRTDLEDVQQLVNGIIDDLQLYGLAL